MFSWISRWQILVLLIDTFQSTNQISTNQTSLFSVGFFCLYCGRADPSHSHFSQSNPIIDCSRPYSIFCSSEEAIGCVKYIQLIDHRLDIIKDCLRFTELPTSTIQCQAEHSPSNVTIQKKIFCCNDTPFCNSSLSLFFCSNKHFLIVFHLFILLIYHSHFIDL